ncbi:MAG: hypothetical protein DMD90_16960 [Candidatus Rokuibacteriota bacterium]|nr:MAG: hypothetical protein DMD90_16960 [Candidatus Rokubacteria bacterium]
MRSTAPSPATTATAATIAAGDAHPRWRMSAPAVDPAATTNAIHMPSMIRSAGSHRSPSGSSTSASTTTTRAVAQGQRWRILTGDRGSPASGSASSTISGSNG